MKRYCAALVPQVTWGTSPEQVMAVDGRVPNPSDAVDAAHAKAWREALDYMGLTPGQLIAVSDRTTSPWQKPIDASISQPKQFGSHQSKLVLHLLNDAAHRERLKPGSADWLTLVTWVDANAPYRSTCYQKFDDQGRALAQPLQVALTLPPPFAPAALAQQEK